MTLLERYQTLIEVLALTVRREMKQNYELSLGEMYTLMDASDALIKQRDILAEALLKLADAAYDMSRKPVDEDDAISQAGRLNTECAAAYDALQEAGLAETEEPPQSGDVTDNKASDSPP